MKTGLWILNWVLLLKQVIEQAEGQYKDWPLMA